MKRTPLTRSKPLQARKPVNKVSAKRKAYRASKAGQDASAHMLAGLLKERKDDE